MSSDKPSVGPTDGVLPGQLDSDWKTAADDFAKALKGHPKHRRTHAGMSAYLIAGLSRFLHLTSAAEARDFQVNYPSFFPDVFWNCYVAQVPPEPIFGLDAETLAAVRRIPPIPLWRAWQSLLRAAWHTGFDRDSAAQLLAINLPSDHAFSHLPSMPLNERTLQLEPAWDYQRAVIGMALENWRAHFCFRAACKAPFIAERPKNKYCSTECRDEEVRGRHLSWWRKNRRKLNAQRRAQYRSGKQGTKTRRGAGHA